MAYSRIEVVQVDLMRPSVPHGISVAASTDATIDFQVLANGTAYDASGMEAAFVVTTSDGRGLEVNAVQCRRGLVRVEITSATLGDAGDFTWQLIVTDGETTREWARGKLTVKANPSAEYVPTRFSDPTIVRHENFDAVETLDDAATQRDMREKLNEILTILRGRQNA